MEQQPGQREQEQNVGAVRDRGEPADEPRELRGLRVPRRRAGQHEEVEPLALYRGKHLERDDEHHVAVAHQRAQRRSFGCALRRPGGLGLLDTRVLGELSRVPAFRLHDQREKQTGRHRRRSEQALGAAEDGEERPAGEAPGHEAEREAGNHARVQRLEAADVEEHPGLADHEQEADRYNDRYEHQQGERDPVGSQSRQHCPRCEERGCQTYKNPDCD